MSSTPQSFQTTRARLREAQQARTQALDHVRDLCEHGRRAQAIPYLLTAMRADPAIGHIRLWQIDSIIFHSSRERALNAVRRMRRTINDTSTIKDGYCDLQWALATQHDSQRLACWLYQLLEREHLTRFTLPQGFPFTLLYDTPPDGT